MLVIMGGKLVFTDRDTIPARVNIFCQAPLILLPSLTKQVAEIVRLSAIEKVAFILFSGATGEVAGIIFMEMPMQYSYS